MLILIDTSKIAYFSKYYKLNRTISSKNSMIVLVQFLWNYLLLLF